MSCIFCSIVRAEIPSVKLHEDAHTVSFLDIRQTNDGHCLVIPKAHAERIYDLASDVAAALMNHAALVARAMHESVAPDGILLWQSNGAAAGQEIDHVHFHVFPRYHGDRHFRIYPHEPRSASDEELESIAAPMKKRLSEIFLGRD